jgi:hypothetical protein
MSAREIDPTLLSSVERDEYVVEPSVVAEAVLRSWMLVAPEAFHGSVGAQQEESRAA